MTSRHWSTICLIIICSIILGGSPCELLAQKIQFEKVPSELGLSQNYISSLYQDSDGFIWVGTRDGLNRFDGYEFKVFQNDPFDSTSIAGNFIKWIFEDSSGRMWIGTTKGLDLFDKSSENFYHIPHSNEKFVPTGPISYNQSYLSHFDIAHIMEDQNGHIWVGTKHGGFNKIEIPEGYDNIDQANFTVFTSWNERGLWDKNIRFSMADEKGTIWVHTEGNLTKILPEANSDKYKIEKFQWKDFNPDWGQHNPEDFQMIEFGVQKDVQSIHSIFKDDQGAMWIKYAGGFAKWLAHSERFTFYTLDFPSDLYTQLPLQGANGAGLFDNNGRIWMAGVGSILVYDTTTHQIIARSHNEGKRQIDIPKAGYNKVIKDFSGNIWVGTTGYGLYKYSPQPKKFESKRSQVWASPSIRSLIQTSDGTIWYSSPNLRLYRQRVGETKAFPIILDEKKWIRTFKEELSFIYNMREDALGNLWLASGRGLFKLYLDKGEVIEWKVFQFPRPDQTDETCEILDVHINDAGEVWIMTQYEFGQFHEENESFDGQDYLSVYNGSRLEIHLPSIYQHDEKTFYLGTASGLLRYTSDDNNFDLFQNDPQNKSSLSHNLIKCIEPDPVQPKEALWIATGGGGLNYFNLETEQFHHYNKNDGLADNVIYSILPDNHSNLWLSTNRGVSRFSLEGLFLQKLYSVGWSSE